MTMVHETTYATFGKRLKTARTERDITIREIALAMDVDPRTVNKWQAGDTMPRRVKTLVELANLLGKPVDYFIA